MPETVVFISYSHGPAEHQENVLGLAERLRQDGLDARLDQYVSGTPDQGWPRWMMDQLDEATFVLVVCTQTYYRRFRGHEKPGKGKGADWEGALITQEIYDVRSRTTKFVPVMLAAGQESFIPNPLRGQTYYELTSEERYQGLYAFLLDKAGVEPRHLGVIRPVTKQAGKPMAFVSHPSSRPIMIGVPHRNPFFAGREDLLARLHQRLQSEGISALAQAAIYGLGGIGKTQTAIEYAHRFGKHYRFVLWVVAEEKSAIQTAYLSLARELQLVEFQTDLEMAVHAVKAWLVCENDWLLIFDNADDPTLIRAFLPSARLGGKILLTSRSRSFKNLGIQEPFRVEALAPNDAILFLSERTGNTDVKAAAMLAEALGYLPLALEQAAAYIDIVGGSFADYLTKYRRQGLALLEKAEPTTDYPRTVATTWALSFNSVRESSLASAELLIAAAFLVPDAVPVEVFTLGGFELGILLARALRGAPEDPLIFWELLAPLERYSLVERLPGNSFKLHRLTQDVVKRSLSEWGRRLWAKRILRALEATLDAAYLRATQKNWELSQQLIYNIFLSPELRQACKLVEFKQRKMLVLTALAVIRQEISTLQELTDKPGLTLSEAEAIGAKVSELFKLGDGFSTDVILDP